MLNQRKTRQVYTHKVFNGQVFLLSSQLNMLCLEKSMCSTLVITLSELSKCATHFTSNKKVEMLLQLSLSIESVLSLSMWSHCVL